MHAEWTGVFNGVYLRLRAREDGILQVTRDLSGQFRGNEYSPVIGCPEGSWTCRTEAGSEVFALPGLCVRADRETGALSFEDGGGNLLLRENPDCPAELKAAKIRRSVFSAETRITERTGRTAHVPPRTLRPRKPTAPVCGAGSISVFRKMKRCTASAPTKRESGTCAGICGFCTSTT